MRLRERFLALQSLLAAHDAVWRPAPFHVPRPAWCDRHPALARAVLALDDLAADALADDPATCAAWLAPQLPALDALAALTALPSLPVHARPPASACFDGSIPTRKRHQIEAFAAHGPTATGPLLEWCAGKGHLGRRLALADRVPVTSLEIDPRLCADAEALAARSAADQTVVRGDALDGASRALVRGREVLALHACGELHRTLVRHAAADGAAGYRIAPCCYHLGTAAEYRPLGRDAALALDAGTLRLAVTETVTAAPRTRRRLARDQAWKLAFTGLREAIQGPAVRTFRPVPASWLAGDFSGFAQQMAAREGLSLPATVDWEHWLAHGERRRGEVRRLELVRHAFRRALETWLLLDLALGLEEAGFEVAAGRFCERALTPRNLLLTARRPR